MKQNDRLLHHFRILSFLLALLVLNCLHSAAQSPVSAKEEILPPAKEKFRSAFELVSPWAESGCILLDKGINAVADDPNCIKIHRLVNGTADAAYFNLYNSDGSLWYSFSMYENSPEYIVKKPKKDFMPLTLYREEHPSTVILRMTGESPNWYEVEINEQTRATKYVLKSEPRMWAKTTWEYWLYRADGVANIIEVDNTRELLRDGPDGEVIETPGEFEVGRLRFLKAEGDWALVDTRKDGRYIKGWIRWRNGRDFLLGCVFNNFKVPSPKTNATDQAFLSKP